MQTRGGSIPSLCAMYRYIYIHISYICLLYWCHGLYAMYPCKMLSVAPVAICTCSRWSNCCDSGILLPSLTYSLCYLRIHWVINACNIVHYCITLCMSWPLSPSSNRELSMFAAFLFEEVHSEVTVSTVACEHSLGRLIFFQYSGTSL